MLYAWSGFVSSTYALDPYDMQVYFHRFNANNANQKRSDFDADLFREGPTWGSARSDH